MKLVYKYRLGEFENSAERTRYVKNLLKTLKGKKARLKIASQKRGINGIIGDIYPFSDSDRVQIEQEKMIKYVPTWEITEIWIQE